MAQFSPTVPIIKLMLIGDSSVGKSCLIYRFVDNTFSTSFMATVGIDFKVKDLVIDNQKYKVQVWDTAGQERFHTVTHSYYRGAMGILLVYDVTNSSSFDNVTNWLKNIDEYSNNDAFVMIIGNKIDLMDQRKVSTQMGIDLIAQLRDKHRYSFLETSARSGENVDEAFQKLSEKIISHRKLLSERKDVLSQKPESNISNSFCGCN